MPTVLHIPCDLAGGGAERLILELCRRAGPGFSHAVAPLHRTGVLRDDFVSAGVPIFDLDRQRGHLGLRAVARLARLASTYDIVHTHLWAGDTWGRLGAALARSPAVLSTEHNTQAEAVWRQRLSVAMHPLAQRVVAVSQAVADSLIAQGMPGHKVVVIDNGVDLERFSAQCAVRRRSTPSQTLSRVLGIGRLEPQKGFDLLAAAVVRCPGLELELAGEGSQAAALAAGGARLLGWQPDVAALLARAELVVIPSRWEGFGLVAVEAMASGLPVIAADVPGLCDVVGDAALRVAPGDVGALAAALKRVVGDAQLRGRLSRAGPQQAGRFSIQACVSAYQELYGSMLAER